MPEQATVDADEQLRQWADTQGYIPSGANLTGITTTRMGLVRTCVYGVACGGIFILMFAGIAAAYEKWGFSPAKEWRHEREAAVSRSKAVVLDWLESQRKGREGREFWLSEDWVRPTRLYAVRSWEVVDDDSFGNSFTVRIASSTKVGSPVEVLWTINLKENTYGSPAIYSVRETISD